MTGCVPEGDFDVLVADLNYFREELNSHCCFLGFVEFVADVSGGDIGLARAGGSYDDYLEHLVIVLHPIINLFIAIIIDYQIVRMVVL